MVSELIKVVPPPRIPNGVAGAEDWARAESRFGVQIPDDFKDVNRAYGAGWFDDFFQIMSPVVLPGGASTLLDYDTEFKMILDGMLRKDAELRTDPDIDKLVPIACTQNGDEIFYLARKNGRAWDVVVVESRATWGHRYKMELSELLAGVFSRRIRCDAFPPTFPSAAPTFDPVDG